MATPANATLRTQPFPDGFCEDYFWDLTKTWYTSYPDFTLCFQKSVLVWVPCFFLWLMLPIKAAQAMGGKWHIKRWTSISISKMAVALLLAALSFGHLCYFAHVWKTEGYSAVPTVDIIEPTMKFATFILAASYIFIDKRRAHPSSGILFIFWFLMLLTGAVRFRTSIEGAVVRGVDEFFLFFVQMLYFPLIVTQFVLSCFAEYFPELETGEKNPCPERFASIPNRITLWWFTSLVYYGWKKPLTQANLWDVQPRDATRTHSTRLEKHWNYELERMRRSQPDFSNPESARKAKKSYEPSLTKALFKSIWMGFALSALLRVLNDACVFIAPQVLKLLIAFVSDRSQESWKGYIYIAALFCGTFPQILLFNHYFYISHIIGMHTRSALINVVYQKALRLSNAAKRTSTVGEIVNLMAVDSQKFSELIGRIQILWAAPLQIAAAIYFLWQELGPSVLSGLGVMVLLIPINSFIIRRLRTLQVGNMKNKDSRIKLMNEVLSGMKILKLYAWEESFQQQLLDVRERELKTLFRSAYLNAATTFLSILSPFIVAIASFSTYVLVDDTHFLNAEKAFVSLSLFNILRQPVNNLPDVITAVIQAQVSIKRLQKFLQNGELDPSSVTIIPSDDQSVPAALNIRNGVFAWETADNPCLKNINLDVPQGKLVAVVGQVGAGKSSLCSAVLGLMEKISGTVTRKFKNFYENLSLLMTIPESEVVMTVIGTCGNRHRFFGEHFAWIQNLTLKDNILFGLPYEEVLYNKVLDACALGADLQLLPAGDLTEIGEKGINLSGGQKQRVSLARAVYSRADIYIMDDPLSAVDAYVGKHIFDNIIGPSGMLSTTTRILVTHGVGFLPKMDLIVVLDSGSISEIGTYKQLLQNNGAFAEFLAIYLTEHEEEEGADPGIAEVKEELIEKTGRKPSLQRGQSVTSQTSMKKAKEMLSKATSRGSVDKKSPTDKKDFANGDVGKGPRGKLVEKEKSETGSVKWQVYVMYLKHLGVPVAFGVFILYICSNAASMGTNLWLGEWSADSEFPERRNNTEWRDWRLQWYGVIGSIQGFFILASAMVLAYGQNQASRHQHEGMLKRILRAPMSFFDTTPLGRIINRFSKDIDVIDGMIPMMFRAWLNSIFNVIVTITVICISTPVFASVIAPLGILYYLIQRFYIPSNRQLRRLESVSRSPIFSHFQESLTGSSLIVATRSNDRFILQNEHLMDRSNRSYFPNLIAQRWLAIRVELLGVCITMFAALFAVVGRDRDWGISPKDIGLSISYAMQLTATLNWLVAISSNLEANIVSVERVKEYSEIPVEAPWIVEGVRPQSEWPPNGEVEFRHYQTRYRPELAPVLNDIDCHIQSGEKVGIVGRTGAGKSSLTLALFRIIERTGGAIVIDKMDIADIGLHDLRSRITTIPQEPVLFSGSLRLNLDPFGKYSDDEVWLALDNAHLRTFVSTLPTGLQHNVAEGGDNLSVGQRQLICLARALLRKTKILVLDEATAAIDLETDTLIQQTIRDKFADCTVLTIAHRLNTIMDSTRVLVLDQGVIREFDTPANLLRDPNSLFYGLARSANLAPDLEESVQRT